MVFPEYAGSVKRRAPPLAPRAVATSLPAPGRWLGPQQRIASQPLDDEQPSSSSRQLGVELSAEQWDPLGLGSSHGAAVLRADLGGSGSGTRPGLGEDSGSGFGDFLKGDLPRKLALLLVSLAVLLRTPPLTEWL